MYYNRLLDKTNEELVWKHGERRTTVGRSTGRLLERVGTGAAGAVLCIGRDDTK